MSANRRFPIALALTLATVACGTSVAELTEEDRAVITAIGDSYLQALVDGDWAAYTSLFAEDAVEFPPSSSVVQGRSAMRAFGESLRRDFTSFQSANVTIAGQGDLAYRWMDYDVTSVPAEGGEQTTYYGKLLSVMRKQADGSWMIVADMWNTRPPPSGS